MPFGKPKIKGGSSSKLIWSTFQLLEHSLITKKYFSVTIVLYSYWSTLQLQCRNVIGDKFSADTATVLYVATLLQPNRLIHFPVYPPGSYGTTIELLEMLVDSKTRSACIVSRSQT